MSRPRPTSICEALPVTAIILQLVMGIIFGVLVARDPEEIVWKKLGITCALTAVFLSAGLQQSDASGVERMSLILFLLIPFLWGVAAGVEGRLKHDRKKRR